MTNKKTTPTRLTEAELRREEDELAREVADYEDEFLADERDEFYHSYEDAVTDCMVRTGRL
jgi:hypothetical protein